MIKIYTLIFLFLMIGQVSGMSEEEIAFKRGVEAGYDLGLIVGGRYPNGDMKDNYEQMVEHLNRVISQLGYDSLVILNVLPTSYELPSWLPETEITPIRLNLSVD